MASLLLAAGGCGNDNRVAQDGAGAGARNWLHAVGDTNVDVDNTKLFIMAFNVDADDMNNAAAEDYKLQWRVAAGSFADLSATGAVKWITGTDLVNGGSVIAAEDSGANSVNCTAKGWSHRDGVEAEGTNAINLAIAQDAHLDFQWAISLADSVTDSQYEFRLVSQDNTVIKVGTTKMTSKDPTTKTLYTRQEDGTLIASMPVQIFQKISETELQFVESGTSNGSGEYSFSYIGTKTFRHFGLYANTPDEWDMSEEWS